MLSSSKPEKHEAKFATRLDVLSERVDTLASTVATTASAIAKKDGEIAGLRRELQARDEAMQALAAQARATAQAPGGGTSLDANELRSLRNAVAALTKERAENAGVARLGGLAVEVRALAQRVEQLAAEPPAPPADGAVQQRLDALAAELASLRAQGERSAEAERPSDELRAMLTTLRSQVEALATLRAGATDEHVTRQLADVEESTGRISSRLDALAANVDAAVTGLSDKERELAALHRHFTESSGRIESIVEDIRAALSAFPEPAAASVDELAARLERFAQRLESLETASRGAAEARERTAAQLAQRIEALEQRVATVASEVARAKALWPVALRSLEARLDDVAGHARRLDSPGELEPNDAATDVDAAPDADLLAGLRDSLQAMESVAAEMARASDVLAQEPDGDGAAQVAAAGGTIVPLRSPDG